MIYPFTGTKEVDFGIYQQVAGKRSGKGKFLEPVLFETSLVEETSKEHSGKEGADDTDEQRRGKTFDRS